MIRIERSKRTALLHVLQRSSGSAEVIALLELCELQMHETARALVNAPLADVPRLQGEAQAYQTIARLITQPTLQETTT
jgi:hypothetical protein